MGYDYLGCYIIYIRVSGLAADRATKDATLQIPSNFYFKFWTLVPPPLSIDFREMPNGPGGKTLMRRDQWSTRGGRLVNPPAASRVMWLIWNSATPSLARGHFLHWNSPFTCPFTIYALVFVSWLCEVHNETRTLCLQRTFNEMLWEDRHVLSRIVHFSRTVLSICHKTYNSSFLFL